MTEPDLLAASNLLRRSPRWTLFTHQKADGDAMGAASALYGAGLLEGKSVSWFTPDPLPSAYRFLRNANESVVCADPFPFDDMGELFIFLDCSNEFRSVKGMEARSEGLQILNIDHHEDNSLFGSLNCVDPSSSSTSELVFRILKAGRWRLGQDIAESLYTGIWTDSGGFSFSNTSPLTHRLAAELIELGVEPSLIDDRINQTRTPEGIALWGRAYSHVRLFGPDNIFALAWLSREDFAATGAQAWDTEGMPSSLMRLRGVRMAAFLTEQESGEVRVSFRSRAGVFESGEVARSFGGGGHPRAAGATLSGPLPAALEELQQILVKRYVEWNPADR